MNPFAGVYMSKIKCVRCHKKEQIQRWEIHYDLSLEVKDTL